MKKLLKISKEIFLPIDAITQTFAEIGRKGAGKTYLATMMAEQMLDIGSQVVAIDPVGNWWGLRVDADGKSKGKEIFVIGGDHGDVPLVPEAGARIAQLIVEKSISAVIDVSSFRLGERKRFCTDFGEELFHLKKKDKTPMHIFIEEAQLVIPQRVGPDEARMVGAFEQIVRLGRNYGIGCSLVTQRPQSVNKEVLSQVECLCVLQVTGIHERKALEEWVQEVGADRKLIGELPGLERGEGYVWSPSWLRIYKRVHFSKKETFDASATPIVGQKTKAAALSAVDVESLKKDMADVVEQAEKDDPSALRKKIAELNRMNTNLLKHPFQKDQTYEEGKKIGIALVQKDLDVQAAKHVKEINKYVALFQQIHKIIEPIIKDGMAVYSASEAVKNPFPPSLPSRGFLKSKQEDNNSIERKILKAGHKVDYVDTENLNRNLPLKNKSYIPDMKSHFIVNDEYIKGEEQTLKTPEKKILNAIAWLNSIGVEEPDQTAVAFLAGYTYGGGAFNNPRGALRTKGLVEYRGNKITLTPQGQSMAEIPDTPLTTEELHERVLNQLKTPHRRILKPLLEVYPNTIRNEELAAMAGYEIGGAYNNPKGRLRSLGLIEYLPGGEIRAKDILFIN